MTSRMFPFITKTWNPIAGGSSIEGKIVYACPFKCNYCWARHLINLWEARKGRTAQKYKGPYRIHPQVINQKFKPGDSVAVQLMSDIGAPGIPSDVIITVFDKIRDKPEVQFLLLTKSDKFYSEYMDEIPSNCICGITMETDLEISIDISKAPPPQKRLDDLLWLKSYYPHMKTFVSIEPIMCFSSDFIDKIRKVEPWGVAVGYDNYDNGLPEPNIAETKDLISELRDFTTVHIKTLRDSLPSQ